MDTKVHRACSLKTGFGCCVVYKAKVTIWEGSPAPAGEGAQQPLIERRSDDPHVQVFAQRL